MSFVVVIDRDGNGGRHVMEATLTCISACACLLTYLI